MKLWLALLVLVEIPSHARANTEIIQMPNAILKSAQSSIARCSGTRLLVPGRTQMMVSTSVEGTVTRTVCLETSTGSIKHPRDDISVHAIRKQTFAWIRLLAPKSTTFRISWSAADYVDISLMSQAPYDESQVSQVVRPSDLRDQHARLLITVTSTYGSAPSLISVDLVAESLCLGFLPMTALPLLTSILVLIFLLVYFDVASGLENLIRTATVCLDD
ncbi:hypothetical protein CROQUDRAFT_101528 [Cronartium quercuum f. sp. fusiforme G11]|uniref:Uncharacterized protein n=1 Tax=Cronartium quercuum f. sp. fusiforme G11 TaxID=708437 RepID=A0A9P6N5B0_9BASI|nr:hypothetical protein CROQUDRAFT_101528 [Cronartium quercuum f. sp. fusiforme G11]